VSFAYQIILGTALDEKGCHLWEFLSDVNYESMNFKFPSMPEIQIITEKISRDELREIAKPMYGELVKAVVDIDKRIMAVGGELHADEERALLERGSRQENLWGINLYPDQTDENWIEFDSMINVRPSQGNRSRNVEDTSIQIMIRDIIRERIG